MFGQIPNQTAKYASRSGLDVTSTVKAIGNLTVFMNVDLNF